MRWLHSILALAAAGIVTALSSSGNRLLVVTEEAADKDTYSTFFGDLEGRGFSISFESPKSEKLSLFTLGERTYDHILILPARSKGLGPALTPQIILDFMKAKGNVLLTLSANNPTPTSLVSLLLELDIHLPSDRNALVVDHFNYDTLNAAEKHDVVLLPRPDALREDVVNYFRGTGKGGELIAFPRGVGQVLGNDRPLLAPVLRAPRTAYSYSPKSDTETMEDLFGAGSQLALVSTMQALNSARFTVIGAAEMLENKWFEASVRRSIGMDGVGSDAKEIKTSNRAFAEEISGWTFNEIGVLKVDNVQHWVSESPDAVANATNPKMYRIKNKATYTVEISEYAWTHYKPYTPPPTDTIQLEFSMLSPFHRLPLVALPIAANANSTTYSTTLTLPDQHGIFNFMLAYKRPFLSLIEQKDTVTVRHFAHDEYDRSWQISGSWPWVAGIVATVVGWCAFCAVWLYSAPVVVVGSKGAAKKVQ